MAIVKISGLSAGSGGGGAVILLGNGTGSSYRCGNGNNSSGGWSTVSGGYGNTASGNCSTISGGYGNTASGYASTITGGYNNTASASYSTISGGYGNTASGNCSTISGGLTNTASGYASTISGGCGNTASGAYSVVSGGRGNAVSNYCSTVINGYDNIVADNLSIIANSYSSCICIGGYGHTIISSPNACISNICGYSKLTNNGIINAFGGSSIDSSSNSIILGGDSNFITNSKGWNTIITSNNGKIQTFCGTDVTFSSINNSSNSCIYGGAYSSISNSYACITQSSYSSITNSGYYVSISNSNFSSISNAYYSSIVSSSDCSSISNSSCSHITCSPFSKIFSGDQSCIQNSRFSIASGCQAWAYNYGQKSYSNGNNWSVLGGSQQVEYIQFRKTNDNTPTALWSDGNSQLYGIVLQPDSQLLLNILTQGIELNGGSATSQDYVVVQRIGATPATIIHQDVIKQHFTTGSLDITIITDPLTNTLMVMATGETGKTYHWTSYIFGVEIIMAAP